MGQLAQSSASMERIQAPIVINCQPVILLYLLRLSFAQMIGLRMATYMTAITLWID